MQEVIPVEPTEWSPATAWRRFCGFLDFSAAVFADIQERLLRDQIDLIADSFVGWRFMKGARPESIDGFRRAVPLTRYEDYTDLLQPNNGPRPINGKCVWGYTATGAGEHKWVPYTARAFERVLDNIMAALLLAAAERPGAVRIGPGDTVLYNVPPRPYLSGLATFGMGRRFGLKGVLDPLVSERMEFKSRVALGFREALKGRVDAIISMTSILMKVGERFGSVAGNGALSAQRAHASVPLTTRALIRLLRARVNSALARRPIMPRDLWRAKAIVGWGLDTGLFRKRIADYWGKMPFEMYACTEGGVMGLQAQPGRGMILSPYADFYEFIPQPELERSAEDPEYEPETLLPDEVEAGKEYEVVITNFYGMPLLRYRPGHLLRVTTVDGRGPELEFIGRTDDRIDIAGFTRIDERTVWKAMRAAELNITDWTLRREEGRGSPTLSLYAECQTSRPARELAERLHRGLRAVDPLYRDLETMLDMRPLKVTLLPRGTFDRYYELRRIAGAPLARRVPPKMNPDNEAMRDLLSAAKEASPLAA